MTKKTKVIASALTTIALCLSLAIGGTFALFTSESQVAVNIVTGTVNVTATAENLTLYSPKSIKSDGTIIDATNVATTTAFANGGMASITDGNVVKLDRMTAGDKVTFKITVTNDSNVNVKYQTKLEMLEGVDLFSGLKITLEKDGVSTVYNGMTAYSQWATLSSEGEVETTTVTIELPAGASNDYQDKTCKLAFTVNAVQGNVVTDNPETDVVYIYNANDLKLFAASVNNGTNYADKTVKLMDNIDLAGIEWTPVGQTGGYSARTYFQGTFDGNNKTISNLTIRESSWEAGSNAGQNFATGFFGFIDAGSNTIKNVTFDNATVEGHHWVGVVAGYMTGTVSGVKVTNSTVTSTYKNGEADGDKAGGIVGYLNSGSVTGCTVSGSTITAVRDCGSVVGHSNGSVTGNTAENCTVYYTTDTVEQIGGEIAGKRANGVSGNTANNVTVAKLISTAAELSAALNATYTVDTTIALANDIDLTGVAWGVHTLKGTNNNTNLTIDGNGKTISGLTTSEYTNVNGFNSNGLVTAIMSSLSSVTFKNLTVSGANLTNNGGWNAASGVFVGDINTVKVTFENCTVTGANVTSSAYAAGFIGYVQDVYNTDPSLSCPVTLKNCTVTNSTFNGGDATGAMIALNNGATIIDGATVTDNTINGGAGYSAAALVGTSINGTTATGVTATGNTFNITGTNYQVNNATYGYIYKNGNTYTVNGAAL